MEAIKRFIYIALALLLLLSFASCGNGEKPFEAEMLSEVNEEREKNGLSELTLNSELCGNALVRAEEIASEDNISHIRPDGSGCFTVLTVDYSAAGENLAKGQETPEEAVKNWMNSEAHRENILSDKFSQAGFACYESGGTKYWVQLFIG